ncbi:MAG TPA: hypothetical protein VJ933_12965, partial [Phaeodactylibacter sp.]|nr:hypothetical protein [Phaeodactylibacter sp.]
TATLGGAAGVWPAGRVGPGLVKIGLVFGYFARRPCQQKVQYKKVIGTGTPIEPSQALVVAFFYRSIAE